MRPGIIVLTILCACSSIDAGELTSAEKAAQAFSYQNIRIGTTLKDFKRRFPSAFLITSDKSLGTSKYVILGGEKTALVKVFRGNIYFIHLKFSSDTLSKIGGQSVLKKKLVNTFGRPHASEARGILWVFPNVQRMVLGTFTDGGASITVYDTAVDKQVEAAKVEKLDLGF